MSKGRVLLIGGDPDVSRTLQVYLNAHQFSAQAVNTGDAAMDACRQSPPDAVILNWDLPDVKGYDLCQQLREYEETLGAFLLVLLPDDQRDTRLTALEAGADDVRSLPFDIEEIRLRIEEMLSR